MEIMKSFLMAFPTWLSFIFMVVGMIVTALFAVRLGYGVVVAKTVYKWIEWAETNIVGSKMGEEEAGHCDPARLYAGLAGLGNQRAHA